jgi:NAD(P)-dependent dehydrogenase (short-subunit alcohol dehydrogenase family)
MYNPYSLKDKRILITGASSGIGRACAIECSKLGAKVIITGRNKDKLEQTFSLLEGPDHKLMIADLSNMDDIEKLTEELPIVDGLVNNAGIEDPKPVHFIDKEDVDTIFNINAFAPMLLVSLLTKKKKLNKKASIVFTASISGLLCSSIGGSLYSASKSALNGFIKGAALDLANKGIRLNSICPGMVKTNILQEVVDDEELKNMTKEYPLKRLGEPNDIAYAIIFLLSDASSWITGTNLVIDGGFTLL